MNRMRLRISERLKQSQNTAASLTTFQKVDMSQLMDFRRKYKDEILKTHGVKLGVMSAFTRAAILAMKDIPSVNASIEGPGSGDTIVYRDYVDVSVAVATEKGLVTPVVRNAEALDMIGIEAAIADLGRKVCRAAVSSCAVRLAPANSMTGTRQQTHHRRHGGRDLHHIQRWGLWLPLRHPYHQPPTNSRSRSSRHQR